MKLNILKHEYEMLKNKMDKIYSDFYKQEELRIARLPKTKNGKPASVRAIEDILPEYRKMRKQRDKFQHIIGYYQ